MSPYVYWKHWMYFDAALVQHFFSVFEYVMHFRHFFLSHEESLAFCGLKNEESNPLLDAEVSEYDEC